MLVVLGLSAQSLSATTRRVLFIGNSYTYVNNMPLMLQTMAAAMGDTLIYDESDPGGYTFALHSTNATTISKIFSQQWDLVVLQEQSQLPSFPPTEVDTEVYPYARKLDSMIHANDSCTQTIFLMTWGHANGDPLNCSSYPVICTYAGMQQRLRESYMQMAQDNNAIVAPVGVAWKAIMDSFPSIWLYMSDSSHPLLPGSYLETSVLYASIFHRRTLNCSYTAGLATSVTGVLQSVADRVVFDSLSQWQQYGHYPFAGFSYSTSGTTVSFSEMSTVPAADLWSYGDGGLDTGDHPVHTYATTGSYTVTHKVTTNCFSETLTDTLHLGPLSVNSRAAGDAYPLKITQNGNGNVTFMVQAQQVFAVIDVYDAGGRLVKRYTDITGAFTDNFVPGFYVYRAYAADRSIMHIGKLAVY